jgi:hypothetical protein
LCPDMSGGDLQGWPISQVLLCNGIKLHDDGRRYNSENVVEKIH